MKRIVLVFALLCVGFPNFASAQDIASPTPTGTPTAGSPTPGVTPTAPASASPSPSTVTVQDLAVTESADLVEPGGRIKHPSEVTSTVTLTWSVSGAFVGAFEIERAVRESRDGDLSAYQNIGTQPSATPTVSFSESMPLLSRPGQSCYRVRSVAEGASGPYSNVACTIIAPSTGPGATATVSPTPLAPPTGGGAAIGSDCGSRVSLALGMAALAASAMLAGWRRGR